ncbi:MULTISPECIES: oligoendopeptidase F [Bacillus]|uniref:oligoendopeptidase F n=1 Tax=Bacillus TaxID=1386 RepID=UPI0002D9B9D7|nr:MULTISPECIES: oligoendopeptidase F [Bacillus]
MITYNSRNEVPEQEKWNLNDLYSSIEAWESDYSKVEAMAQELAAFDGKVNDGKNLLEFLTKQEEMSSLFNNVYVYGMLKKDLDTRDSEAQVLTDKASNLAVKINSALSFFTPQLLSIDEADLKKYIAENEGLKYFEQDLIETYRYKQHVLTEEKEALLSQLGESLGASRKTYEMINNADIQFGEVMNKDGEKVELTRGMYSKLIEDEDREVRKEAYKAYYKPYLQLKNSIASTLSSAIKTNVTLSNIRQYPSALEKALFGDMVSKDVYENLIQATKNNLAPVHKYTEIRKEKLGLDELHQYDLSVDLVKGVKQEISYDEAYDTMLKALKPLGDEYLAIISSFKDKRYIDVRETPGKRSGAYNLGVYGVHPFVLLNHHDDLDSCFTLTHELGHAMHSWLSSSHQPRISAGYSIFVAEVASTVNEVLLINYLIENAKDDQVKAYLINHFIDQFRGTFYTQVMFAEFEKITHELAANGVPLNVQKFNEIYEKLFREYNGDMIVFDDEVKYGWSRIPHFYRPFYVYKYATGYASAIYIADQLLKGNKDMQKNYLEFLKSGSSDYPLELLKKTGVDLTNPEPINNALQRFSQLVDQFASL